MLKEHVCFNCAAAEQEHGYKPVTVQVLMLMHG